MLLVLQNEQQSIKAVDRNVPLRSLNTTNYSLCFMFWALFLSFGSIFHYSLLKLSGFVVAQYRDKILANNNVIFKKDLHSEVVLSLHVFYCL